MVPSPIRRAELLLLLAGCAGEIGDPSPTPTSGVRFEPAPDAGFWQAPFPGEHRRLGDGTLTLTGFDTRGVSLAEQIVALLDGVEDGVGTTSPIVFPFVAPIDPGGLPDLYESVDSSSNIQLLAIEGPYRGERIPVLVDWRDEADPWGPGDRLTVLPLQGAPLRPSTRYAAVIQGLTNADGSEPERPRALATLLEGGLPSDMDPEAAAAFLEAVDALEGLGFRRGDLQGLSVFETGDPTRTLRRVLEDARDEGLALVQAPEAIETWEDYCVYQGRVEVPVYQGGEAPYLEGGGGFVFADGRPQVQRTESARVFLTLPRAEAPPEGWPVVVFVRTGGGGDRPLIDRGVRDADGHADPGTGLAVDFARSGFAGVMIDGPLGGVRNPTGGDEQFLIFSFTNPAAMRDNLRQSAVELALLPDLLPALAPDAAACPGASLPGPWFDAEHLALFGHSMGATIAPATLAVEPRYRAAILSGAGGSWIENVVHKQSPIPVRPLAETLIDVPAGSLDVFDPVLGLLQWGGEGADPPVYGRMEQPPHVLMLQGIVDTYILPPMANSTSLSLGLDLAGPPLDADHPELQAFTPLAELLPLVGSASIGLPASGNRDGRTAVVVQEAEDGVEDGHEVAFQLPVSKARIRAFLEDFAVDRVPEVE